MHTTLNILLFDLVFNTIRNTMFCLPITMPSKDDPAQAMHALVLKEDEDDPTCLWASNCQHLGDGHLGSPQHRTAEATTKQLA